MGGGHRASEDDHLRIYRQYHDLDSGGHMYAQLPVSLQRLLVLPHRTGVHLLPIHAPYVHEIGTATEIFQDLSLVGNHAKFSRATISVGQQLAILDNSTPQTRTQGEAHEVINRLSFAKDTLTQSEAIRVVIHINRHGEASLQDLLQMYLLPMRDIHHVIYDPLLTIHHARHTDTDSYHTLVPHGTDHLYQSLQCLLAIRGVLGSRGAPLSH